MIIKDFDKYITPYYNDYLANVSDMAPSLKTLKALILLCRPGASVIDLGSGFSSFVLAYYAEHLDLDIWSIDDSPEWLKHSEDFCVKHGYDQPLFLLWSTYEQLRTVSNDVIFFDIGRTPKRPQYYNHVLNNNINPHTVILFDDMHKPILKNALDRELSNKNYHEQDIKNLTLDQYGRYCRLIYGITKSNGEPTCATPSIETNRQ